MKRMVMTIIIFLSLFLFGCTYEENVPQTSGTAISTVISETTASSVTSTTGSTAETGFIGTPFINYSGLSYSLTKNGSSDYADISGAYYYPELSTVCVNVAFNDPYFRQHVYVVRLSDQYADLANAEDRIISNTLSGSSTEVCFQNLTKGDNYIHVLINLSGTAIRLVTLHYDDTDFLNRARLTSFEIHNETADSVQLGQSPYFTVNLQVQGSSDAIGKIVLEIFDTETKNLLGSQEYTKTDFTFINGIGVSPDYHIAGLAPDYPYHLAMLFYPPRDLDHAVLLDTEDWNSPGIVGVYNVAFHHYLYSYIYDIEYGNNETVFKTFIKNDPTFLNSNKEPYQLYFQSYTQSGELLYSAEVADGQEQITVSNVYLSDGGYVKIVTADHEELSRVSINMEN